MDKREGLRVGDVVQLDSELTRNRAFASCFMVVSEPHEWGAQGYVRNVGAERDQRGARYFYRAEWEEMTRIGEAAWLD